jgi:hypothetical protein
MPFSRYSEMTGTGYGAAIDARLKTGLETDLLFFVNVQAYFLTDLHPGLNTGALLPVSLSAAYSVLDTRVFHAAVFTGAGYSFHFVNDAVTGPGRGWQYYGNPSIAAGFEGAYSISSEHQIVFRPGWNMIFNRSGILHFAAFNLGLRMIY